MLEFHKTRVGPGGSALPDESWVQFAWDAAESGPGVVRLERLFGDERPGQTATLRTEWAPTGTGVAIAGPGAGLVVLGLGTSVWVFDEETLHPLLTINLEPREYADEGIGWLSARDGLFLLSTDRRVYGIVQRGNESRSVWVWPVSSVGDGSWLIAHGPRTSSALIEVPLVRANRGGVACLREESGVHVSTALE